MSLAFNMTGGGGGTGGTLTVNAPAGATVTVTNNEKTYTRTANSDGVAVFKGLASGTWYVSIDDADHDPTAPVTVEIVADYEVTVTFFAATINITYPAGSTCKAASGTTEIAAPDTSGTWDLTVPFAGTWTIYATDGTDEAEESVEITTNGQSASVELNYNTYLYIDGDQCTSITGGWAGKSNGWTWAGANNHVANPVFNSNNMVIVGAPGQNVGVAGANNAIDLTTASKLIVEYSSSDGNAYIAATGPNKEAQGATQALIAFAYLTAGNTKAVLDASGLSGGYYLCVCQPTAIQVPITRIYLK